MSMALPNLIIAGAPKCGTTSLFDYLAAHPEVCPSKVKETCYLMDEDYPLYKKGESYHDAGLVGYERYFQGCGTEHARLFVEATPDYMYQHTPLEVLPTFREVPTVIFVLRKPSERVYSLYRFAKNNLAILDKHTSFYRYMDMVYRQERSLKGRPILLNAIEHSKYSNYIAQWMEAVGSERVRVFLFEEMVADPAEFMIGLSEILGIDQTVYESYSFGKRNETYAIRSTRLHRLMRSYGSKVSLRPVRWIARGVYKMTNLQQASNKRSEEDKQVLRDLEEMFAPYNTKLAEMTALNLARWS